MKICKKITDGAWVAFLLAFLLMFFGQMLGQALNYFPVLYRNTMRYTAFFYLQFSGVWLLTLLYLWMTKKNRPILQVLGRAYSGNTPRMFLLGFVIGTGLNAFCILCAWLHGDVHFTLRTFNLFGVLYILLTVFIQSSSEELLCRGFLYQRLLRKWKNPWMAIAGNAAFFAALHLLNDGVTVLSFVNIVVGGILFSFCVCFFDSMWFAMAVHTGWNFTQSILFGLPNSGVVLPYSVLKLDPSTAVNSFAYDVGFGVEGTIAANVVMICACAAMAFWGFKHPVKQLELWTENDPEVL